MKRSNPQVGDVVEMRLPNNKRAYGRVLKDGGLAVYKPVGSEELPIGSRDYQFVVGIYLPDLRRLPVVAHDPSSNSEEDWPPPSCITDALTGAKRIYYKGRINPSTQEECEGLEPTAAWHISHIIDRIEAGEEYVPYSTAFELLTQAKNRNQSE